MFLLPPRASLSFHLTSLGLIIVIVGGCASGSEEELPSSSSGGAGTGGQEAVSGGGGGGGGPQGSGGAGGSGGQESEGSGGGTSTGSLPSLLSETGLFAGADETLEEGVFAFTPQFELWSDGADKRRWIWLPPDTQIDSSDMDAWVFPHGTKLWKEFSRDGVRVETRLIQKSATGSWSMVAYQWRADLSDAEAVPDG